MSKTYDAIEFSVEFVEYYAEDAQTPKGRYVRARWAVTLKHGTSMMKLDFHTGLRNLEAPKGFARWFGGSRIIATLKMDAMFPLPKELWRGKPFDQVVEGYLKAEFNAGAKFMLGYPKDEVEAIKKYVRPKPPTKQDVLYCIASELQGIDCARNFEDWASNYGYDTDSRKAERIYHQCVQQASEFRALCGGAKEAEDCAAFALAIDEYSLDEARVMWGEKAAPEPAPLPADPYEAVRKLGEQEWERLLAMALEILQENHLLAGGEFVFAMGVAQFVPAEGAKDADGFKLQAYSTNTDNEWPTDPLKAWHEAWERYVETFGYPSPVRFKADGVRQTDW